jgi:hypothetical protein
MPCPDVPFHGTSKSLPTSGMAALYGGQEVVAPAANSRRIWVLMSSRISSTGKVGSALPAMLRNMIAETVRAVAAASLAVDSPAPTNTAVTASSVWATMCRASLWRCSVESPKNHLAQVGAPVVDLDTVAFRTNLKIGGGSFGYGPARGRTLPTDRTLPNDAPDRVDQLGTTPVCAARLNGRC